MGVWGPPPHHQSSPQRGRDPGRPHSLKSALLPAFSVLHVPMNSPRAPRSLDPRPLGSSGMVRGRGHAWGRGGLPSGIWP